VLCRRTGRPPGPSARRPSAWAVRQGPSAGGRPTRTFIRTQGCPDAPGRRPSDVIFPKDVRCDNLVLHACISNNIYKPSHLPQFIISWITFLNMLISGWIGNVQTSSQFHEAVPSHDMALHLTAVVHIHIVPR
jgi:hypothetical protein